MANVTAGRRGDLLWRSKRKPDSSGSLIDYRKHLVEVAVKSQESLDRAFVVLSGGALGVSLVFVKDIVGDQAAFLLPALLTSWVAWAACILFVLATFECSRRASHEAIRHCDEGSIWEHAHEPGGVFSKLTKILNRCTAISFVVGAVAMMFFVTTNLMERNERYERFSEEGQRYSASRPPASNDRSQRAVQGPSSGNPDQGRRVDPPTATKEEEVAPVTP